MNTMNAYHVAKLVAIAAHLSGYTAPAIMPAVHEVTSQEMKELACGKDVLICGVIGVYMDEEHPDEVFVDAQTTNSDYDIDEDAVVVHELTHWLQHKNGKNGEQCHDHFEREREAYHVENLFIRLYENKEGEGQTSPQPDCL